MDFDAYTEEVMWQLEFQGIVIDTELYGVVQSYWQEGVSPVGAVGLILGILGIIDIVR